MKKDAKTVYPVHALIKSRWSPRAFDSKPVQAEHLHSLFEAARWSPSGGNQQPWRFIIGCKGEDTYDHIFHLLDKGNQVWAGLAPVLVLSLGRKTLNRQDSANSSYRYDVGQAVAMLSLQATELGLFVHQMAGFNADAAREIFEVPEIFDPITVFAIGYSGDLSLLDEVNQKRELAPRDRMPFGELVFSGKFGKPSELFQ